MPNAAPNVQALLPHLFAAVSLPFDPGLVNAVLHAAATRWDSTDASLMWTEQLARLAEPLRLQCQHLNLPIADAPAHTGPQTPLVTYVAGTGEWLLLEVKHNRRVSVRRINAHGAPNSSVKPDRMAACIGAPAGASIDWVSVQAVAPLQAATSVGDEHLEPLQRLRKLLGTDRHEILLAVVFAVGVGLLSLATPVAVQALVNTFALGGLLQPLIILSLLLFVFLAFSGALRVLQTYVVEIIQRRIFVRVLGDLAYRLPRLRSEVMDRSHGTELVNRFFDVLTVQKVSAVLLLDGVAVVLQTLIGLLVLAFYHPLLLAFDTLLVSAIAFIVLVLGRGGERTAIAESKAKYAAAGWLEEIARNPIAFKLHGGARLALERADLRGFDYLTARSAHFSVVLRQTIGSVALQAIAGTALLAVGGDLVIEGQLTLGQLVAAELIVSTVLASFAKFGKQLENFYDLLAAVDKLGHVVDQPLEPAGGLALSPDPHAASLRIHDLQFTYPDGTTVFSGFNLAVRAGERLAVVGGHGSGKSTLGALLFGLRTADAGRIELNGINIRDLRFESLRRYVAIVTDAEIIEDTVLENLRMGRTDISIVEVRQALDGVTLLDEILDLPDGLHTVLGHAGTPLSFGQTQRLALARALVGRPNLVVVDGILDRMEPAVQEKVCDYLFAPAAPWTVLVLALYEGKHTRRCDRVVALPAHRPRASNGDRGADRHE
jgi:ABC-type bacteriocin/lantibiotic exporter with double-glycine peptidase domain